MNTLAGGGRRWLSVPMAIERGLRVVSAIFIHSARSTANGGAWGGNDPVHSGSTSLSQGPHCAVSGWPGPCGQQAPAHALGTQPI